MSSVNKVILIGNLGKDPEIRTTQDGKEIASFSIATSETWKDRSTGERKEKTEWHRISVFNPNLVNVIKNYVKKGSKLYVEGQLQTRKWADKEGKENYTTEVVLQAFNGSITLLDKRDDTKEQQYSQAKGSGYVDSKPTDKRDANLDDEIPFN